MPDNILKHTPGPWDYFGRMVHIPYFKNDKKQKGRFICDCMTPDDESDDPEDDANAQLIAAAPDMLGVLLSVAKMLKERDYGYLGGDLINVIEKATGKKIEDLIK